MNNQEKIIKNKSHVRKLLSGIAGRLFLNESKSETAVFIAAVLFSAVFMVLDIVNSIIEGKAGAIIMSLTVGIVSFLFVLLLTVSDRFYVVRGRSMILIAYSVFCIILSVTGFIGVSGVGAALAILGLISALALYGTLIYDQLMTDDHPVKYWLVYCGALYRILYALVMLIINSVNATGVTGTLKGIFEGLDSIAVLVMLLYLFDGFSFAKYMYFEIIDSGGDSGADNDTDEGTTPEAGSGSTGEENIKPVQDSAPEPDGIQTSEGCRDDSIPDDAADKAEYMPYTEDDARQEKTSAAEDKSAEPEEISKDNSGTEKPSEKTAVNEVAASREETEEAVKDEPSGKVSAANVGEAELDAKAITSKADAGEISLVELKYVRFAAAHNRPDETLQVTGMSGDLFDVWVDNDTICFLNDLGQAEAGRGVRSAAIPFGDVSGFRFDKIEDGAECVVLMYMKGDETREIRFTKESFANFKQVMEEAGQEK